MNKTWSEAEQLFYEPLISAYLDGPGTVAREWMQDEIREQLSRPDCRFVLLVGEPGAGKTGFLSALARGNPDWLRYFVRSDSTTPLSDGDATSLMLRIGHQLAHRHPDIFDPELLQIEVTQRVEHADPGATVVGVKIEDLQVSPFYRTAIRVQQNVVGLAGGLTGVEIARATIEPRLLAIDTLSHLALLDPALVLVRKLPNETIVVLIDALDEVIGKTGGSSILDWLESFAESTTNIRFVLSSRPSDRLTTLESIRGTSLKIIHVDADSPQVVSDVRMFATTLFDETQVLARAPAFEAELAIPALTRAAQGNFAYLTSYARALRTAVAAGNDEEIDELLKFESLPAGLSQLYATFARRMRRQIENLGQLEVSSPRGPGDEFTPAWEGVGQRLLGVLAVAFAPLSLKQLVALGGIRVWESAAKNVLQILRPFLDAAESGWKLFHPSLAGFLTSEGTDNTADVVINAREWHTRIVRHYRGAADWADVDWGRVDSYGLVNIVSHIAASDDSPAAAAVLVTAKLRAAIRERFLSDLPFRRILQTVYDKVSAKGSIADVLTEGIFLQLVLSGLSRSASVLAPAIYGLMARLGRVDEALARADVLEPGLRKYRTHEAIWKCTPAGLRTKLGPLNGVERLVGTALEIPVTSGALVGMLGYDLSTCLDDAAIAMVPHDFTRALHLAKLADRHGKIKKAVDGVYAAAIESAPPDQALELLSQMQTKQLKPAVDAAERAGPGPARVGLIEFAMAHLNEESYSSNLPSAARLYVLLSKENSAHSGESIATLRSMLEEAISPKSDEEDEASSDLWGIVHAAELLHDVDAGLAERLLKNCDHREMDFSLVETILEAAHVWKAWGYPEEARIRLNKALDFYRANPSYRQADDIAKASQIAASFDPEWGDAIAGEAMEAVERAVSDADMNLDQMNRYQLDTVLANMVETFRHGNRERALKLARFAKGDWISGSPWDSTEGLGGLAMIGLDVAESDPKLAEQLLTECMAESDTWLRLGRPDPRLAESDLYRSVTLAATASQSTGRTVNNIALVSNFVNYWVDGRNWRFFYRPADILRSIVAVFPNTDSWARAIAASVLPIAQIDIDRAMALVSWLADPCERLVAYAALAGSLDERDQRAPAVLMAIATTLSELPTYEPQLDLSKIPQGPYLAYLNPALRARFEAALLMPSSNDPSQVLPLHDQNTWYLHTIYAAEELFDALFNGVFAEVSAEDLDLQLDGMSENYGRADPLVRDLLEVAATYAMASKALSLTEKRIESIENPSLKLLARLIRLPFEPPAEGPLSAKALQILGTVSDEVLASHRAELAATAVLICQSTGQNPAGIIEWGLEQLESAEPLLITCGIRALVPFVPKERQVTLSAQALGASDQIGNQYVRNDTVADWLRTLIDIGDVTLVAMCIERLLDAGWIVFMDALRRAMPSIVNMDDVDLIERMDASMRRAQRVLMTPVSSSEIPEHFDGVLGSMEREQAAAALSDKQQLVESYLSSYLDPSDLGPSMPWVQDSRIQTPDPDDQVFIQLHGLLTGLSAWQTDPDQAIWRIVDIRFLFDTVEDAATYHRERLEVNSEGQPPVHGGPVVGEDCFVFGGTNSMEVSGVKVTLTSYYYIFRVGRVVAKLFIAQGPTAEMQLTTRQVASLAERIVQRIRTAGLADE